MPPGLHSNKMFKGSRNTLPSACAESAPMRFQTTAISRISSAASQDGGDICIMAAHDGGEFDTSPWSVGGLAMPFRRVYMDVEPTGFRSPKSQN
jgi:hypothetical protein